VNNRVISLIGRCPKPSITARSAGTRGAYRGVSPNMARAIVLLPLPDGPTIRPIRQGGSFVICHSCFVICQHPFRHVDPNPLGGALPKRHVEHPAHLLHAERVEHGTGDFGFKRRHREQGVRVQGRGAEASRRLTPEP